MHPGGPRRDSVAILRGADLCRVGPLCYSGRRGDRLRRRHQMDLLGEAMSAGPIDTPLTRALGIEVPLICGAMYPCTDPELVAAVSEAGGIGIVQPMALTYVHGLDYREGLRRIRQLTDKPIGVNLIMEKSAKVYEDRLRRWLEISLEEGVRFFVTSLGKPDLVVEKAHAVGGLVYHDVTERKWAERALQGGVDGLICVNRDAGGHPGRITAEEQIETMGDLGVPLVCAGGVGDERTFVRMLGLGFAGVQMGTRFIATRECKVHDDYKQAIVRARSADIVWTDKISGVPVAVINTPYVQKMGVSAGPIARRLLGHSRTKHWMRMFYTVQSLWRLKRIISRGSVYADYWQAGRSVEGVVAIESAADVVDRFAAAARGVEA